MTQNSDWYPTTLEGEREMYSAILANLDEVDTTLKMEAAKKTRLLEMAQAFVAYDENLTLNRAAVKSLGTGFKTLMDGKKGSDPMPEPPKYHELTLPAGDFVGMENEMREMRRYMTGLFTWTENMGDVLKLNGRETDAPNLNELSPDVKIKQVEGRNVYVSTKKEGMDGTEYQWRIAGETIWQPLMNSGEADAILEIPIAPGEAKKIELRAIFLRKFKRVGIWSPTYNASVGN